MAHHSLTSMLTRRAFLRLAGGGIAGVACAASYGSALARQPAPDVSLDMKIGQMVMVGFGGSAVNDSHPIVQAIQEHHLGGVILMEWAGNIQSAGQVTALVEDLQAAASVPLLVSIDHEGGMVNPLKEAYGFPATVSHQHLGNIKDLSIVRQQAASMAQTLAQLGINLNLAPVVDVNTNPNNPIIARYQRSFSADPAIVTSHAQAFIAAHREHGVLCAPKHFPGHGSSAADSHLELTDITTTWNKSELQPYRELIRAGYADVIMTAHVFNANLDISYPATLSQPIITGMLRDNLGYDGVVISDDMQMGAITNYYGFETAILKAIEAGVDIILYANTTPDLAARATRTINSLVQSGLVSPQRIDESYQRIHRLKRMLPGYPAGPDAPEPVMIIDTPGEAYFPATAQTVRGPFLDYWQRRGGLTQFGFPITGEIRERGYTVQYFERARFEHYPENAGTLYEVQLSPLGSILTADRRDEAAFQRTVPGTRPGTFIAEAGHHIAPEFIDYWRQGGLLLYGYPISEAFREPGQPDGQTYLVQYFERARFEHHPENPGSDYDVLLGMLGREMLNKRRQ